MKTKTKIIISSIAIISVIVLLIVSLNKEHIFCPHCYHIFTIVEVQKTDRSELKTDWLGCTNCRKVFVYNWDGKVEKAWKFYRDSNGDLIYKEGRLE